MTTKANFRKQGRLYLLALVALIGGVMTACSDDKDPGTGKEDPKEEQKEPEALVVNGGTDKLSINRLGGMFSVPVTALEDWKASVVFENADELEWVEVFQQPGTERSVDSLVVNVDYLSPLEQVQQRTAKIVVESGDKKQTLSLSQYIGLKEGETADNASTQPYADLWASKGIGSGFDVTRATLTSAVVFNTRALGELAKQNDYSYLLTQTSNPDAKYQVALLDSLEEDSVRLKVECKIDVKYAGFKLGIKVNYDNQGLQAQTMKTYNASQQVVFLSSNVDAASIAAFAQETEYADIARKVLSPGFKTTYKNVTQSYGDEVKFKKAVEKMLSVYGPVVVTGADLGGSLFVSMRYDSLYVENKYAVSGKVDTEVMLGAINVTGGVDVQYARKGADIWENSQHFINASGGGQEPLINLTGLMGEKVPDQKTISAAAQTWISSIVCSNNEDDNTALVNVQYTGIWNFFPFDMCDEIREIAMNYYQDKKVCVPLDDMGVFDLKSMHSPKK